jgi:hypothetical protein
MGARQRVGVALQGGGLAAVNPPPRRFSLVSLVGHNGRGCPWLGVVQHSVVLSTEPIPQ